MPVYAIGDIQGCQDDLERLLDKLNFDPARDRLWFTGDLVNRGTQSLQTLRFVKGLGDAAITVLGNHDLHLLAVAFGHTDFLHKKDTLDEILAAPDRDELLNWLRRQPLLHHDAERDFTLIHAGLPPQWDLATARSCAVEVEEILRGPDHPEFFANMYGNKPAKWSPKLSGWERPRFITNCLTRLRFCTRKGKLDMQPKGPPGSQRDKLLPWYAVGGRASAGERIIFGHWSTLQMLEPVPWEYSVFPLDDGCLWGGALTALRLEDQELISVDCSQHVKMAHPERVIAGIKDALTES